MKFLEMLLQSGFIQALGWTLVHAIWQVALVALLLMLALPALRKSSASVRYRVSLGAMIGAAVLSGITFLLYYNYIPAGNISLTADGIHEEALSPKGSPGFFQAVTAFFNGNLFTLVMLWAAGVGLLSLRFAGSIWYLQRLRSKAVFVTGRWAGKVAVMAEQSGIRRVVRLAESAIVRTPMMIGHLKPLILVPAGMLAAIPAEQVEAILAHELGHIRRNDFLVNLLQSAAEILYFFHPGIWWISSIVRRERELCCDDVATGQGCSPVTLAFALSEVGEWAHSGREGQLAMAFTGRDEKPLLTRIKRLLGQEPSNPLSMLPAAALVSTMILFLLLAGSDRVFSSSSDREKELLNERRYSVFQDTTGVDTLPEPKSRDVEIRRERDVELEQEAEVETEEMPSVPELELSPMPEVPPVDVSAMPEMPELEVPPAPEMDAMAPVPPVSPVPPLPPVMDSVSWNEFTINMKDLGENVGNWVQGFVSGSDTTKDPDFEFNFDEESMKDFELSMEDFGKKMEAWGETYGKKMEAWAKANEPKFKEFELKMKIWEKENKPKFEEYERKMKEWEKKNEPRMKEFEQKMKEWEKENKPKLEEYERKMEKWRKEKESRNQHESQDHNHHSEQKG